MSPEQPADSSVIPPHQSNQTPAEPNSPSDNNPLPPPSQNKRNWNFKSSKIIIFVAIFAVIGAYTLIRSLAAPATNPSTNPSRLPAQNSSSFCQQLGKKAEASSAVQLYCFGVQRNGPTSPAHFSTKIPPATVKTIPKNVPASDLAEDVTANGTRGYGQAEVSVASAGKYVVEAWNDATGFLSQLCAPMYKDQMTGIGFSSDGGNSFKDLGGLKNDYCYTNSYYGDPSVVSFVKNNKTYFYISSLFGDFRTFSLKVTLDVCSVDTSKNPAQLNCSEPIVVANGGSNSLLDKAYMTIDSQRQKLYTTYTDFTYGADNIDLSVCDLAANPLQPACTGNGNASTGRISFVALSTPTGCAEDEGAYPAVDPTSGDVYVAYEHNWGSNIPFFGPGCPDPINNVLVRVPYVNCLAKYPDNSGCPNPNLYQTTSVPVVTMDTVAIAGYNRFPANDFPRIAVSQQAKTVSIVWNDASVNPMGDILLQSFSLGSLQKVQATPLTVNDNKSPGTLHFMPALRNTDRNGNLNISWYDRRANPSSAMTDLYGVQGLSPKASKTSSNNLLTDRQSNWLTVSSDIVPNFGDYIDNYYDSVSGKMLYAWTDGRVNAPQAYFATR